VDVDGSPELYTMTSDGPESGIPGAGETLWVSKGPIISKARLSAEPQCAEPNTTRLLALATES
jgi:hypothetical protein